MMYRISYWVKYLLSNLFTIEEVLNDTIVLKSAECEKIIVTLYDRYMEIRKVHSDATPSSIVLDYWKINDQTMFNILQYLKEN